MKPGVFWIIAGVAMAGMGIVMTVMSKQVIMYGAIAVGIYWIIRGIYRLVQASKTTSDPSDL